MVDLWNCDHALLLAAPAFSGSAGLFVAVRQGKKVESTAFRDTITKCSALSEAGTAAIKRSASCNNAFNVAFYRHLKNLCLFTEYVG